MAINWTALLIIVMIGLLVLSFRLSSFLARRAMCQVIGRFRDRLAIRPGLAVTLEELGLSATPRIFTFGLRDYKPYAVQILNRADIIQMTVDGRFFLSEEKLRQASALPCRAAGLAAPDRSVTRR